MIKLRSTPSGEQLFDPLRKKWLAVTEEEKVRQFMVHFLINELNISSSHISLERQITVNGLTKRYDIVVFNKETKPWIVIECKAPQIALTQEVLTQVGVYNLTLNAEIIGVTNGSESKFFRLRNSEMQLEIIDIYEI